MAFSGAEYMTLIAHGGPSGFKLYHYLTTDAAAAIDSSGHFDAFASQLDVGDVVLAVTVNSVSAPTSVSGVSLHVVLSNDGTTVDVSDTVLSALADTD